MKPPKNYYNSLDRMKQDLDTSTLPDVTTSDAGKVLKVSEAGGWELADDENTIIEANPEEGTASEELQNLKIGDTIYSVNKPTFEYIKGIRLTISDGGQYRTDKPKVEFYDDGGNLITTPTYTSSCDKEYQGNISLNQVCSIATTDAPGAFTYVFDSDMAVTINHLIKLTNAGSFAGDIAKSVKVELTSDGENWIELWFDPSIAWSGSANAYRIIDIKTGEVSNTLLPIVTSADNGKLLTVVNGVWDAANPPTSPVPTATTSDNYSKLVVKSGNYVKMYDNLRFAVTVTENAGVYSGNYQIRTENGAALNSSISVMDLCMFMILLYLPSGDTHGDSLSLTGISYSGKSAYALEDMLGQVSFTDANGDFCHFTDITVSDTAVSFKIAT